jgi:hypothetical protein
VYKQSSNRHPFLFKIRYNLLLDVQWAPFE